MHIPSAGFASKYQSESRSIQLPDDVGALNKMVNRFVSDVFGAKPIFGWHVGIWRGVKCLVFENDSYGHVEDLDKLISTLFDLSASERVCEVGFSNTNHRLYFRITMTKLGNRPTNIDSETIEMFDSLRKYKSMYDTTPYILIE
jgi:hypothetical protein